MKNLVLIFLIIVYCNSRVFGQKIVNVENNNGKITVNNYNQNFQKTVLNVGEYIDIKKPINIIYGNSRSIVAASQLKDGWFPFDRIYSFGESPLKKMLKLSINNNHLKIFCEINSFDETNIAIIKDNKIIKHKTSNINFHITGRFMEVIDEYGIPVFQIELNKKKNAIIIGGAFNYNTIYFIIWRDDKSSFSNFGEKLLMSEEEYKGWLNTYLREAKTLVPISE